MGRGVGIALCDRRPVAPAALSDAPAQLPGCGRVAGPVGGPGEADRAVGGQGAQVEGRRRRADRCRDHRLGGAARDGARHGADLEFVPVAVGETRQLQAGALRAGATAGTDRGPGPPAPGGELPAFQPVTVGVAPDASSQTRVIARIAGLRPEARRLERDRSRPVDRGRSRRRWRRMRSVRECGNHSRTRSPPLRDGSGYRDRRPGSGPSRRVGQPPVRNCRTGRRRHGSPSR